MFIVINYSDTSSQYTSNRTILLEKDLTWAQFLMKLIYLSKVWICIFIMIFYKQLFDSDDWQDQWLEISLQIS